eukprot:GHVQ01024145.1.p1 GENE.GHVQ01024145.1~~GHVQ01024145.1.p1  ORF type:complete len:484 (-),score=45.18 GHVQ01024145.1:2923-4374(-)
MEEPLSGPVKVLPSQDRRLAKQLLREMRDVCLGRSPPDPQAYHTPVHSGQECAGGTTANCGGERDGRTEGVDECGASLCPSGIINSMHSAMHSKHIIQDESSTGSHPEPPLFGLTLQPCTKELQDNGDASGSSTSLYESSSTGNSLPRAESEHSNRRERFDDWGGGARLIRSGAFESVRAGSTAVRSPLLARSVDLAMQPQYHSLEFSFTDFEIKRVLGEGAMGVCVAARERRTKYPVCIKMITKLSLAKHNQEYVVKNEIELQSHLHHPNIVPLLTWFHDSTRIALVMKYCSQGDLFHFLSRKPRVDAKTTSRYLFDVLWALRYCHHSKIAHLDIKPENILVHRDRLLVGDFGMSEHLNTYTHGISKERGTHDYWSPEQTVRGDEYGKFDTKADVWAVGILTYEIFLGTPPFGSVLDSRSRPKDEVVKEIKRNIREDPWNKRVALHAQGREVPPSLQHFISWCLQKVTICHVHENTCTARSL